MASRYQTTKENEMTVFAISASLWCLLGFASFVWWWTKQEDLTPQAVFLGLLVAVIGPLAFVVGWLIHGDADSLVLIKRRGK